MTQIPLAAGRAGYNPTCNAALQTTRLVHDVVDVIEAGTILCLAARAGCQSHLENPLPGQAGAGRCAGGRSRGADLPNGI